MRLKSLCPLLILPLLSMSAIGRCEIDLRATPEPTPAPQISSLPPVSGSPLMEGVPIDANCGALMLLELESGQSIFEMNADSPRPVASVTKLMTILLTLEMLDQGRVQPDDVLTISASAAGMGGSQVLLDVGERQPVSLLLRTMIVGSANDSAVALAEALYGSESACVEAMNRRAEALGMTGTHYENCTGLPADGQHTTARDIATLSRQVFSHPLYFEYSGVWMEDIDHGDGRLTQMVNTNKLIRLYDGCDGGKTGSTKEAGYCVSATALRGDMRLIAIVLGAETGKERFAIAQRMFDYGFANYRRYPVAQRGARVRGDMPVEGGVQPSVPLALDGDLTLLIPKGQEQSVQLSPNLPESVSAPIAAGDRVGSVGVRVDGREVSEISIVAAADVDAKGLGRFFTRVWQNWGFGG